jgi:hypothetical protein
MAKEAPAARTVEPERCPDCEAVIPTGELDLLVWADGTLRVVCPTCSKHHLLISATEER